jgi:hypothetical protein
MNNVILTVEDTFKVKRGTVVTGLKGDAWTSAKRDARVELRSPTGGRVTTSILKVESFRPSIREPYGSTWSPLAGILLPDTVTPEQTPRGTQICEVLS